MILSASPTTMVRVVAMAAIPASNHRDEQRDVDPQVGEQDAGG